MERKNLIVAPCGNKSFLFRTAWLKDANSRTFDLCLLFYHQTIDSPGTYKEADFFYHLKDFKYHMLYRLFTEIHPEWLEQYEYFYFLDDDIDIDTQSINALFESSRAHQSWISQAALSKDSFCSWPIFKQRRGSYCRFVGQIEVMAPLFSRFALTECLPSFIGNRSSWGVDSVWAKLLGYPKNRFIVFDRITMRHTLPVGGGELYQKIGVDPHEEWNAITRQYNARKHNYREYGRLQLVDQTTNKPSYLLLQTSELISRFLRVWNDYDLMSRLQNQKRRIFGK